MPQDEEYYIYFEINDYSNHKKWDLSNTIKFEEYRYISEISLFGKIDKQFKKVDFLEKKQLDGLDSLWLQYQIIDFETINLDSLLIEVKHNNKNIAISVNNSIKNYDINLLPINLDNFEKGKMKFEIKYKDVSKEISFERNNSIDIDYDVLIEPIIYILSLAQYYEYENLNQNNKIEFIKEYWSNLNNNKLLFEFYNRVKIANNKYSDFKNIGSISDRGEIYIIKGPPISIERKLSDDGEYEIWNYNLKQYIFINRYGYYECFQC